MPAGEIDLVVWSFVGFLIYEGANSRVPYVGFWDCVLIESTYFFGFFRLLTSGTITFFTAC